MLNIKITCYNCEKPANAYSFYVLSKGLNSGRPSMAPHVNSFVITCSSDQEKDFYYTLCFALWKSKTFHPLLCGSVVPFLRIDDFKKIIDQTAGQLVTCRDQFTKTVNQVKAIEEKENNIRKQLQLLAQLKIAMLRKYI